MESFVSSGLNCFLFFYIFLASGILILQVHTLRSDLGDFNCYYSYNGKIQTSGFIGSNLVCNWNLNGVCRADNGNQHLSVTIGDKTLCTASHCSESEINFNGPENTCHFKGDGLIELNITITPQLYNYTHLNYSSQFPFKGEQYPLKYTTLIDPDLPSNDGKSETKRVEIIRSHTDTIILCVLIIIGGVIIWKRKVIRRKLSRWWNRWKNRPITNDHQRTNEAQPMLRPKETNQTVADSSIDLNGQDLVADVTDASPTDVQSSGSQEVRFTSQMARVEKLMVNVSNELQEMKKTNLQYFNQICCLRTENEDLTKDLNEIRNKVAVQEGEIQKLKTKNRNLSGSSTDMESKIAQLKGQLLDSNQEIKRLERKCEDLEEKLNAANNNTTDPEQFLSDVIEEHNEVPGRGEGESISRLQEINGKQKEWITKLTAKVKSLQSQVRDLEHENAKLKAQETLPHESEIVMDNSA